MNPNLNQNPFADIMARMQASRRPQQAVQAAANPMPAMQGGQKPPPNQLVRGQNSGHTQYLLRAVQSLEQFITQEEDPQDIATARSIIRLLTRLIDKDQTEQTQQIPQHASMLGGMMAGGGNTS